MYLCDAYKHLTFSDIKFKKLKKKNPIDYILAQSIQKKKNTSNLDAKKEFYIPWIYVKIWNLGPFYTLFLNKVAWFFLPISHKDDHFTKKSVIN